MSATQNAAMARALLRREVQNTISSAEAHRGLIDPDDTGALDLALDAIDAGNLVQAVAHLDLAVRIATDPPAMPAEGRNRQDRHQRNLSDRNDLLTVAGACRALLIEGGAA